MIDNELQELKKQWDDLRRKEFASQGFREALENFNESFKTFSTSRPPVGRTSESLVNGSIVGRAQPERGQLEVQWEDLRRREVIHTQKFGRDFSNFHQAYRQEFPIHSSSRREEDPFKKLRGSDQA